MCGITGWASWKQNPNASIVKKMNEQLIHRGPDFGAIKILDNIVLGHRRLSILDLSKNGNQPMSDKNKTIWIVFNGEIYNFLSLKKELILKGFKFFSNSDTEVIINAYKCWGLSFVEKLNGMFALAIWDTIKKQLVLARDRMGEKPLYYNYSDNNLIFSSELKSLLQHQSINRNIDNNALFQYLNLNYTLTNRCMIKSVNKLPPASILIFKKNEPIKIKQYWNLSEFYKKEKVTSDFNELKEQFLELLDNSVKIRMLADVPIGAFLSGGLDSSTVVSSMKKFTHENKIKTFSAGFSRESFDELTYAKEAAQFLKVFHQDKTIDTDIIKIFEDCCRNMCEPMADTSTIPTFELSKFVRSYVKVALTGDGADEILAGYETYKADKLHNVFSYFPNKGVKLILKIIENLLPTSHNKVSMEYKLKKFFKGHGLNDEESHFYWKTILDKNEIYNILNKDLKNSFQNFDIFQDVKDLYEDVKNCNKLDKNLYVDCKTWLPNDILVKSDRASMGNSLETRAPFLDHNIVEFCAQLPHQYKLNNFNTKYILKRSQNGRIPRTIISRSKKGFNAPVSNWLLGPLYEYARDLTSSQKIKTYFDENVIEDLWNDHKNYKEDNGYKIFGILCYSKWLENIYSK